MLIPLLAARQDFLHTGGDLSLLGRTRYRGELSLVSFGTKTGVWAHSVTFIHRAEPINRSKLSLLDINVE
jgi:hypothetical protein